MEWCGVIIAQVCWFCEDFEQCENAANRGGTHIEGIDNLLLPCD